MSDEKAMLCLCLTVMKDAVAVFGDGHRDKECCVYLLPEWEILWPSKIKNAVLFFM